jgi:hypothetical protein
MGFCIALDHPTRGRNAIAMHALQSVKEPMVRHISFEMDRPP